MIPRIIPLGAVLAALALGRAPARAAATSGHLNDWRIEREPVNRVLRDLDPDTLQLVAAVVGPGTFEVRSSEVADPAGRAGQAAILTFAPAGDMPAGGAATAVRVLVGGGADKWWVRGGSDQALVSGFFQRPRSPDDAPALGAVMPPVLLAALYGGQARLLEGGENRSAPARPGGVRPGWTGRFQRADGSVEEVAATLPATWQGLVSLTRRVVAPAGARPALAAAAPEERWTLVREQAWAPNRRYKPMLAMALLGQPQMKLRLAAALLEDPEPSSVAAGLLWLNSAAADGSPPAVERLVAINAAPIRPSRERDGVRMDWCDCFLIGRRPAPAAAGGPPAALPR